eukprot:TRINITY_DN8594_c0_g1_i2.p1 TRINITY_DN8594_c0_g1~~TRINITY_DN8594_c0_g1_i2.p1  ORF type:complete len:252 (+),score=88.45 TRINITY_DN8594_c0_g1_i2:66-758(+)
MKARQIAEHIGQLSERLQQQQQQSVDAEEGGVCGWACRAFRSVELPAIAVRDYTLRLLVVSEKGDDGNSPEGTMACVLLDRLERARCMRVGPFTAHRLFLAALLVSIKFLHDGAGGIFCGVGVRGGARTLMLTLAALGGVTVAELTQLEAAFLMLSSFDLIVDPAEYYFFAAQCQRAQLKREYFALSELLPPIAAAPATTPGWRVHHSSDAKCCRLLALESPSPVRAGAW